MGSRNDYHGRRIIDGIAASMFQEWKPDNYGNPFSHLCILDQKFCQLSE
jgi:hypothetical protein